MPGNPVQVTFSSFVLSLAGTAMGQLGLAPPPGSEGQPAPPDLAMARQTIDLLALLQDKTRGNLDADETRLLALVLQDLRLKFVEIRAHPDRSRHSSD